MKKVSWSLILKKSCWKLKGKLENKANPLQNQAQKTLKNSKFKRICLNQELKIGALNPNIVLFTDQAPSPAFSALNPGSVLNPRTLNQGTTVLLVLDVNNKLGNWVIIYCWERLEAQIFLQLQRASCHWGTVFNIAFVKPCYPPACHQEFMIDRNENFQKNQIQWAKTEAYFLL